MWLLNKDSPKVKALPWPEISTISQFHYRHFNVDLTHSFRNLHEDSEEWCHLFYTSKEHSAIQFNKKWKQLTNIKIQSSKKIWSYPNFQTPEIQTRKSTKRTNTTRFTIAKIDTKPRRATTMTTTSEILELLASSPMDGQMYWKWEKKGRSRSL